MKCSQHPGWDAKACVWCGAAHERSPGIESDRNKFDREQIVQHMQPGTQGIRTHGQYQRFLKRQGMTDDIPTKDVIRMTRDTGKRERVREERIRAYVHQMTPQFQQKAARLFRP